MKTKLVTICAMTAVVAALGSTAHAGIVGWTAESGLLPSDSSFSASARFELSGQADYVTLGANGLAFEDTTPSLKVAFRKPDIPVQPPVEFAYQISLRVNSHSRTNLDWAAFTGIVDDSKSILLIVSTDAVGFAGTSANSYVGGASYSLDTTKAFHDYRVIKASDTVSLFVDDSQTPAISLPYSSFTHWTVTEHMVLLSGSSQNGTADFEVKEFYYNLEGTTIPEPATLSLLAFGGLAMVRRKRKSDSQRKRGQS
jgi:hypothetical protein